MKQTILLFSLLACALFVFAQETKFKEYSYSQLFQMIEEEKDSVFEFSDAIIRINYKTDSLFFLNNDSGETPVRKYPLVIDKKVVLENVHFENPIYRSYRDDKVFPGFLANIHFKRKVQIEMSASLHIKNCIFDRSVNIGASGKACIDIENIDKKYGISDLIRISDSEFKNGLRIFYNCNFNVGLATRVQLSNNLFQVDDEHENERSSLELVGHNFGNFILDNNKFIDKSLVRIMNSLDGMVIYSNDFNNTLTELSYNNQNKNGSFIIEQNKFNTTAILGLPDLNKHHSIDLEQFPEGFISKDGWTEYHRTIITEEDVINATRTGKWTDPVLSDSLRIAYLKHERIKNIKSFEAENSTRGALYDFYKSLHKSSSANKAYVEMKDLETVRLKYLYKTNPGFENFFTLKINQFLKIFSDYGTKPSKAIVFSMYVILVFALIYLFFPNSWDQHGRHRIMHRYTFFIKYLRRNQGIHEVYLEEKQPELLGYENFKQMLNESEPEIPRFFKSTALPLYKWSLSGTKLTAAVLSKMDVMKGTWQEVPPAHRWWKALLLIGAFLLALAWDILIKILNALMLSINTFTTLGFGEIPIKGLPRYLAIIQGFIGWFMLTIFSVSLISQLLN